MEVEERFISEDARVPRQPSKSSENQKHAFLEPPKKCKTLAEEINSIR